MGLTGLLRLSVLTSAVSVMGCASLDGAADATADIAAARVAEAWVAPLPSVTPGQARAAPQGDGPRGWWAQFGDPVLLGLIDAAQAASPGLASGLARIERARADRVAAGAVLTPQLGAVGNASRASPDTIQPITNTSSLGLQAAWELDLFGAARASRSAQQSRLEGAEAAWHGLRVALAAETAAGYNALRACEAQRAQAEIDAASRAETARVSDTLAGAGLLQQGLAAVARAGAAQARAQAGAQQAQCDIVIKSLVALTALGEADLRQRLAPGRARLPQPAPLAVAGVPAQVLAQRPDVREAERAVLAAAADRRSADARQWPSISLAGTLGALRASTAAGTSSGQVWSLGPLQVSFPVFDGGARRANSAAARASYDEAVANYQGRLRQAVREVETALVTLDSGSRREPDARLAAESWARSLRDTETRWRGGLASVLELEDARRNALAASVALISLQRDQVSGWIDLYRALGGGWTPTPPSAEPTTLARVPYSSPEQP